MLFYGIANRENLLGAKQTTTWEFFSVSNFGHPVVYRGPVKPRHQAELAAAPVVLFTVFIT